MPQQSQGLTADWEQAKPISSSDWDQAKPVTAQTDKPAGHGVASGVMDFLTSLYQKQPIHPIDMAQTIATGAQHVLQPTADTAAQDAQTLQHLLQAQGVPFAHAEEAFKKGDYAQGVTSLLNWLIPVIGPQIESAQQRKMSGQINWPQFAGESTGIAAQVAAPGAMENLGSIRLPGRTNANPVVADAVAFGQQRGIPVDAATATGSRAVSAVQNVSDRSLGGMLAGSEKAAQAQAEGLTRVGGELAAQGHPTPVTPLQAGEAVRESITNTISDLHSQANASYGAVRKAEAAKPIPVGMTDVKTALRPLYDSLTRQLPITQQQASPGLKAIKNILDGPDISDLSVAEADLGAVKALTRGAEIPELRGIGRGVAAKAVAKLDETITKAADQAGVGADLRAGRAATASKYQAAEVLSQLRDEPVRVFNQSTYANDAGIEQLRQIAKLAPNDLPKVGRAFLDDLMSQATAEGGFDKARTLATKWQQLGPETKTLLFKDPAYIKDLDRFFLLAKKIGENPNPSGTAPTVVALSQLGLVYTNPATGAASILGTAGLSKLLHSRAGVNLLTRGISIPVGNAGQASAIFGDLTRALDAPAELMPMLPVPSHAQRQGGGQ